MVRCKQCRPARPSKANFRPSPVQLLRQGDLENKLAAVNKPPSAEQPPNEKKTSPKKQSSRQRGKNKNPNFEEYEHDLESAEFGIEVSADYYRDELPKDWKYDRATAGRWKEIPYFYINR